MRITIDTDDDSQVAALFEAIKAEGHDGSACASDSLCGLTHTRAALESLRPTGDIPTGDVPAAAAVSALAWATSLVDMSGDEQASAYITRLYTEAAAAGGPYASDVAWVAGHVGSGIVYALAMAEAAARGAA